jgi:hypothetical protein
MRQQLLDYLTMTLRYGCDQAQETFERLQTAECRLQIESEDCRLKTED